MEARRIVRSLRAVNFLKSNMTLRGFALQEFPSVPGKGSRWVRVSQRMRLVLCVSFEYRESGFVLFDAEAASEEKRHHFLLCNTGSMRARDESRLHQDMRAIARRLAATRGIVRQDMLRPYNARYSFEPCQHLRAKPDDSRRPNSMRAGYMTAKLQALL